MNHFIPLDTAKKMTLLYRIEKENILIPEQRGKDILPICETFEVAPFLSVLSQPGCVRIRIYYSMDPDKKIHAIVVGVNDKDEDMLPVSVIETIDSNIIEEGIRCPTMCPPASPLNS